MRSFTAASLLIITLSGLPAEAGRMLQEFNLDVPRQSSLISQKCNESLGAALVDKKAAEDLNRVSCLHEISSQDLEKVSQRFLRLCESTLELRAAKAAGTRMTVDFEVLNSMFNEAYSIHFRAKCLDREVARFHARQRVNEGPTSPTQISGPRIHDAYERGSRSWR